MKKIMKIFFFYVILFMCLACGGRKELNGIEVSELLLRASKEQNVDYYKLLNEAIKGNDLSIRQLALLKVYDGAGYDHGAVIVDLIERIGENIFIKSLTNINNEQKQWIKGSIEVGLEYGNNPNLQTQSFKEAFPRIYEFLNNVSSTN